MVDRPEWMTPTDLFILTSFEESDIFRVLGPTVVSDNLDISRSHASKRISLLVEHGLLEQLAEGKYRITDRGRSFLQGELDASDLED